MKKDFKKLKQGFRERRVYLFQCVNGHPASSYKASRARMELCRNCRRNEVPENQPALFPAPVRA